MLVQDPHLAALPALADLAQHRHHDLGNGDVDPVREQALQECVPHADPVELAHRSHDRAACHAGVERVLPGHLRPLRAEIGPENGTAREGLRGSS